MDVESLAKQLILQNMTSEQQMAVLDGIKASVAQAKEVQKRKIGENVDLVVQALKKIESDIRDRYDLVGNQLENRILSIKDGRDGTDGRDGRDGKDGKPGKDGLRGPAGRDGKDGKNGVDGIDGVSVISANIDFDGSLIIKLSNGKEINVGEVVPMDLAERIKIIGNGGGTSQTVIDTLASLQSQIDALIPSQTGNSGKFLTTNGSALSWASIINGLSYQGTWNASTNSPSLSSGVGTSGYYYVVSVSGSTSLDGITDWVVGDWLLFNGTAWQKIDQTNLVTSVNSQTGAVTLNTSHISENTNLYYTDARARAAISAGTGISYSSATGVVTNSAPDQTVALTGAGTVSISGTYPNFTITGADQYVGTVTSVGQSFTGGLISVSGSPVTSSGTLALSVAGTSGGIPYFSSSSTWASSSVLAANSLMVGGGAGVAPATTTTGTGVVTAIGNAVNTTGGLVTQSGTLSANALLLGGGSGVAVSSTTTGTGVVTALGVNTGTSGAFVVNGGALGTPSSGTVTNLTGTASININGTVGATTANTGAFTTISASGVITASAGTASAPALTTSGDTNTGEFFPAADTIAWTTGGSERVRIDSSGRLLVNQTSSTNGWLVSRSTNGNYGLALETTTANTSDVYYASFLSSTETQNGYIWRPTSTGVLALVSASDQRLKENISDATFNGLDVVNAVKVREFDWVETKTRSVGFIAQELEQACPDAVAVGEDNQDGTIKRPWAVSREALIPYLVKAIQEQQAIIQQLQADVAALKAGQ